MTAMTLSLTGIALLCAVTARAQTTAAPRAASVAPPAMQAAAPGLAGYTDDVLFGEVWKRPGLSPRDRSLVTVSALVAAGRAPQLAGHAGRALDNGVTPAELAGIVTHIAFYAGWPVAVSAVGVVDEVFQRRGIDRAALVPSGPMLPAPDGDTARAEAVERRVGPVAPGLADLTNRVLFGDVWRRPDLSPRDRALVTVSGLVAAGDDAALAFHIPNALRLGVTAEQMGEAVTHLAFYAGWPKAMAAIPVLDAARLTAAAQPQTTAAASAPLTVTRAGANPRQGPADNFTGSVRVDTPFSATPPGRVSGGRVTFQPGARTHWHTHPLGQTLVVTAGSGLVQREGGPVEAIGPGDIVWIPPGVKHWHGAAPNEAMTHIAISEQQDGRTADWLEPVQATGSARAP